MALPIYLRVGNNGPRRSVGTKVTFAGLDQLEVVSSYMSAGEFDAATGTWFLGLLENEHEEEIELMVKNPLGTSVEVVATISGSYLDPDMGNNSQKFYIGQTDFVYGEDRECPPLQE